MKALRHFLTQQLQNILDFAMPRTCLVCGKVFAIKDDGRYICQACIDEIPYAPASDVIIAKMMEQFGKSELFFDTATCLLDMKRGIQYMELIYALKYYGLRHVGHELGVLLGQLLQKEDTAIYDFIQPVPIHKTKQRQRTYNQSLYIANGISSQLGVPVKNMAIRTINTETQTKLSHHERSQNVANVFQVKPHTEGKAVLLIDDVITTGATINNLAKEFKYAGYESVGVASLVLA